MERNLTNALAHHPDGFRYLMRGLMRTRLFRYDEAEADYLAAVKTPSMFDVRRSAAFYALDAQRHQRTARRLGPANNNLLRRVSTTIDEVLKLGNLDDRQFRYLLETSRVFELIVLAEEIATRWRRASPKNGAPLAALAWTNFAQGSPERATILMREAIKLSPNDPSVRSMQRTLEQHRNR